MVPSGNKQERSVCRGFEICLCILQLLQGDVSLDARQKGRKEHLRTLGAPQDTAGALGAHQNSEGAPQDTGSTDFGEAQ